MSFKSIGLSDELHAYLLAHNPPADPVITDLLAETRASFPAEARLSVSPEQAPFLTLLTRLLGVRSAIEIGTFTGLSSLSIARGLPPDGKLTCFDISTEFTDVARRYWARAGVAEKIELRIGRAIETVGALPAQPHLDLAFIDADKTGYPAYWKAVVPRLRPGGVILVDNVLRHGQVIAPSDAQDDETRAIVAFNNAVLADERVDAVMIPLGDGMTLARRR